MASTRKKADMDEDGDDFLTEVREKYQRASEAMADNHDAWRDDVRFAKLNEQWPEEIKAERERDGRPCLVIPRLQAFIRQVVNEARQNRPAITVVPADSNADVDTAEIMSGLIRNIEVASNADIAYDTAADGAISGGFGYFRINTAYTSDDTFDQDLVIERIADPLTVYPDPDSESVDGSDWNCCFVVKTLTEDEFEAQYKGADKVDWKADGYDKLSAPWRDGRNVMVAEYWHREDVESQIVALSNDTIVSAEEWAQSQELLTALGITQVGQPRTVKSKKVTQYILSGAEVLETVEWPGSYIPIVPVYGDEVVIEGERTFKSLIRDAKDAQREHNYWRSMAAETIALAPKVPFIGPKGAFDTDVEKWSTANDSSHAFIQYDGQIPPQRQGYAGPSAGELQQAIAAIDDMKAIMGIYDASLGQRSNETSGVAIQQRQRQGDVATYHFIDNLTRSIRQAGRILIDLIPKVYSTARIVRILGEDMKPQNVQVAPGGQPEQPGMEQAQDIQRIYDLTAGKYDLIVKAGPAYGTQRELVRDEVVNIIRAFPASAPVLGPMYLRNSDWPGAEEAADKLEQMSAPQQGMDPEQVQQQMGQMQQALQQGQAKLQELLAENETLKQQWALKNRELDIKEQEAATKAHEVKVKELQALFSAQQPQAATVPQGAQPASNPMGLA